MKAWRWVALLLFAGGSAHGAVDPLALFEKPMALGDASGKPLITGKAQGCPYAADYNGDGKVDIVLGAKDGMNTSRGGLWLIPNKGSNKKPAFRWADAFRVQVGTAGLSVSCGCKSSGQVQPVAVDWNGDGWLDIVYSDTFRRTYLLLNDGKSRERPHFTKRTFFEMEKKNHGMYAGGGDWDQDGVLDFLHMPFAGAQYKLFKGAARGKGGLAFQEGGLKNCVVLKFKADKGGRARKCAWAWDYSGSAKRRGVIEYVGIAQTRFMKEEIAFFELANGQSRKIATLCRPDGKSPLLTAGDLNADGKMDIVFSCGLWKDEKEKTKIYVMYGKVKNVTRPHPSP